MPEKGIIMQLIVQVEEAIRRIEKRFTGIKSPDDFVKNDEGLEHLDSIAMMLIAIGENMKSIEKEKVEMAKRVFEYLKSSYRQLLEEKND